MDPKVAIQHVSKMHEAMANSKRAEAIAESKINMLFALLQGNTLNDKEIEQARQECVDAFSACLDVRIEGAKIIFRIQQEILR